MTPFSAPVARPTNATKNPFTQFVLPQKRSIESEGENFIWGNVGQPAKRARIGKPSQPSDYSPCRIFWGYSTRRTGKTTPWI